MVANKYNIVGFGDTLSAIDFNLLENGITLRETYTLVENFGLTYYRKNIGGYNLPEGNFWGAVINGDEFGTLIVNKQQVDWSEYYPLHIGDYWVYEGESGSIPFVETHRITGDTIMPDGNTYFIKDSIILERLDSAGRLFVWSDNNLSGVLNYKFTDILGDTAINFNIGNSFWRLDNKFYNNNRYEIYRFLYPDLIYYGQYFDQGLGLYEWTIEGGYGILKGAYIDGTLYGDTTVTSLSENSNYTPDRFILYPNYPNPFNSITNISFYLPVSSNVQLIIYNMLGEQVKISSNKFYNYGFHSVILNANNMSTGVYICVLNTDKKRVSKKMVLLK